MQTPGRFAVRSCGARADDRQRCCSRATPDGVGHRYASFAFRSGSVCGPTERQGLFNSIGRRWQLERRHRRLQWSFRGYPLSANHVCKQQRTSIAGVVPPGKYKVEDTIDGTGIVAENWGPIASGAVIEGAVAGKPVLDLLGSRYPSIHNLHIFGNSTDKPTYGIQSGRISSARASSFGTTSASIAIAK